MKYGRYGVSHLFMSWGLGIVFAWIGIDMFRHPDAWIGFLPLTLPLGMSRETGLQLSSVLDIVLGILLVLRWWPKTVAAIASAHLIGILVTSGIDAVLIRDVGLLGVALALFFWPTHYRRHRWWKVWQKSSSSPDEE